MSGAAQLAPVPFQVKLQCGVGAEAIDIHHAIVDAGVGRERDGGPAFRHVHPQRRRSRRQVKTCTVFA